LQPKSRFFPLIQAIFEKCDYFVTASIQNVLKPKKKERQDVKTDTSQSSAWHIKLLKKVFGEPDKTIGFRISIKPDGKMIN
jgi:hypothetical protein